LIKNPSRWAEQSREFLGEVQVEFKKVTWPQQKELIAGTVAVVSVTTIVAIALFGVDSVLAWIVSSLLA
jgi:preprotein translocase subunit SecE